MGGMDSFCVDISEVFEQRVCRIWLALDFFWRTMGISAFRGIIIQGRRLSHPWTDGNTGQKEREMFECLMDGWRALFIYGLHVMKKLFGTLPCDQSTLPLFYFRWDLVFLRDFKLTLLLIAK